MRRSTGQILISSLLKGASPCTSPGRTRGCKQGVRRWPTKRPHADAAGRVDLLSRLAGPISERCGRRACRVSREYPSCGSAGEISCRGVCGSGRRASCPNPWERWANVQPSSTFGANCWRSGRPAQPTTPAAFVPTAPRRTRARACQSSVHLGRLPPLTVGAA